MTLSQVQVLGLTLNLTQKIARTKTTMVLRSQMADHRDSATIDRLHDVVREAIELHAKKCVDYQSPRYPLLGLQLCEEIGVDAWKGSLLRLIDKLTLVAGFARNGYFESHDETVREALLDLIAYAALTAILIGDESPLPTLRDLTEGIRKQ